MISEHASENLAANKRESLRETITCHPEGVGATAGVIASFALPIYSVAWKVSICDTGWSAGFAIVLIFIAVTALVGTTVGLVGGFAGRRLGDLLKRYTLLSEPHLIGSIVGGGLATVAGLLVSLLPAFMFAFPDC